MYRLIIAAICTAALTLTAIAEDGFTREENVVYKVDHGVGLVMDVFRPTANANGHAIVDTLSGAWYSAQGQVNDHTRAGVFEIMTAHGYTVFMVRPGSRTKFTAQEMTANMIDALAYIKEHAETFAIDPNNIGIMGASAGGHLTLLTSIAAKSSGRDDIANITTVAAFFPPTDFIDWGGQPRNFEGIADIIFNDGIDHKDSEEVEKAATAISPALIDIPDNFPPVLLIHGDADPVVPLGQSEKMIAKLEAADVPCKLIVKPGGGHPWLTIREEVEIIAEWFDSHLLASGE